LRTDVVTASSDATLKQDATFVIRAGLADSSCYSLESRNFPGQYLRHRNYRLYKDVNDGSALYAQDATFCAQLPRAGGADNVSLASLNFPGLYVRHYAEAVYIAASGGGNAWDNAASYDADTTWTNASPWS
jgi:hypothetical protein